ncbi:hypothetical protein IQ07DRAFT_252421 [Pyrenochaeta sp. DS3sAY3a]|nr:hypothetical protein IQ07DRAFT_252421 [Pyrenochaeta sp. DS3sAY3a]
MSGAGRRRSFVAPSANRGAGEVWGWWDWDWGRVFISGAWPSVSECSETFPWPGVVSCMVMWTRGWLCESQLQIVERLWSSSWIILVRLRSFNARMLLDCCDTLGMAFLLALVLGISIRR